MNAVTIGSYIIIFTASPNANCGSALALREEADNSMQYITTEKLSKSALNETTTNYKTRLNLINLARTCIRRNAYNDAEKYLKQAVAIDERSTNRSPLLATDLEELANCFNLQDKFDEAEKTYKHALSESLTDPTTKSSGLRLNCMRSLAIFYRTRNRFADAEPVFQQYLNEWKNYSSNPQNQALPLTELAKNYASQSKFAEAEKSYRLAISKSQPSERSRYDFSLHVITLDELAGFYTSQGRYDEAAELYLKCLEIMAKRKDPDAMVCLERMRHLKTKNESLTYDQTKPQCSLALEGKHADAVWLKTPDLLNKLACLYQKTGRYTEAEELFKLSLAIAEKTKSFGLVK